MNNTSLYIKAINLVKEIERRRIDITDDYKTWIRIGAALCSLEELGRSLFHRISRFHPEYNEGLTDYKFTNLLRKSRNKKSIASLIYVCKKYGIDTSAKVLSQPLTRSEINKIKDVNIKYDIRPKDLPQPSFHIPNSVNMSFNHIFNSNLYLYLFKIFGPRRVEDIKRVIKAYKVGANANGESIFWQHDNNGKCRAGKIIKYNDDGHRDKQTRITWMHKVKNIPDFNLVQVPFGSHLINRHQGKFAIVESEKTALMAMIYCNPRIEPHLPLFLAVGSCCNLTRRMLYPLRGRNVVLFPDRDQIQAWKDIAKEIAPMFDETSVKDLPPTSTNLGPKADLADWIEWRMHFNS